MYVSQKKMQTLIRCIETFSRYREIYSNELRKDNPDRSIVEGKLHMAYFYGTMAINVLVEAGINPDKVADNIVHFVGLYAEHMEKKKVA